jgi:hypothetical protein
MLALDMISLLALPIAEDGWSTTIHTLSHWLLSLSQVSGYWWCHWGQRFLHTVQAKRAKRLATVQLTKGVGGGTVLTEDFTMHLAACFESETWI